MKKKLFPKIQKKLHNFLTDESGKITKKDALGLAAVASLSLGINEVLAGHSSHTSAPVGGSGGGSGHSNFGHNSTLSCPSSPSHTTDSLSGHFSQTSSGHVSGTRTPSHTSSFNPGNVSGHGSATGHSSHGNHTNHANHFNEGSCFTFAQRVLTPSGYVPIGSLKEGNVVVSFNHDSNEYETSTIAKFIIHDGDQYWFTDYSKYSLLKVYIEYEGGFKTIESTDVHPFYHPRSGDYKKIIDFNIGDEIFMHKGIGKLKKIEVIIDKNNFNDSIEQPIVYNLHMEEKHNHNYFVEDCLVHNAASEGTTEIP